MYDIRLYTTVFYSWQYLRLARWFLDSFQQNRGGGGAVEADVALEAEDVVDAGESEAAIDETPEAGEAG